ncbi:MAG TPA: peroxidase family protein [Sphingomonas sp.]|uniref:peroxidase family protein n=1 Tax=Sphingomonas sp. TaxID=28214 RepID=UPI002B7427F0|nr:peroxidase family protein [Sphingomonas sp.]HMI20725.1 peroxidase family protein [Sphingomonas sp.]
MPAIDIPNQPSDTIAADLFRRIDPQQTLCVKSTMLFPAFAQYLTDSFIRTMVSNIDADTDRRRTTSNHDLDMCALYGRNDGQTRALRRLNTVAGERGRLKSQLIGGEEWPPFMFDAAGQLKPEFHALDEPLGLDKVPVAGRPTLFAVGGDRANANVQVSMLNTLFLREHNRLAHVIETKNPAWDDDHVFEITRNVIIVMFIKLVVEEYINHISPAGGLFRADPEVAWDASWNRPNWITAEFSLLYRWHSLVPDTMSWNGQRIGTDTLRFNNPLLISAGLRNAVTWLSSEPAAALGMGNTASYLIDVELKAIQQGRTNRIASYNAYRVAMSLKPRKSVDEISSNPEIRRRLAAAYPGGVDTVDFYVGLFAEDRVKNSPLPELILTMVAVDAFSQALTNPLLSRHIWGDEKTQLNAFTAEGLDAITKTPTLAALIGRNVPSGASDAFIAMTRKDWKRR